ncbi:MAG: alpha/beta fold hydrolase [Bauldia sp.]
MTVGTGAARGTGPPAAKPDAPISTHALTVCRLFGEAFNDAAIEFDADFFELGGDSMLATSLIASIEKEFDVALPISILLEAPTPRALAAVIFKAAAERVGDALVIAREAGSAPPLCCVHGMNGETVFQRRLADALVGDRPIYALRAIGLQAGERPLETVEQIASNYIAAVRRVRGAGPYVLLGHCGGSLIAAEMAQQLTAAGETVAGLIMIDPAHDKTVAPYLFLSGLSLKLAQSEMKKRIATIQDLFERKPDFSRADRRKVIQAALFAAIGSYAPKPYAGKTLLLYTTSRKQVLLDPTRGFPTLLGDYETVEIKTDHGNMFEHHLPNIVAAIAPFLDRVAAAESHPVQASRRAD